MCVLSSGCASHSPGVVGDDMFGPIHAPDQLQSHGIDTSAVAVLPERATGVTVVLLRLQGPRDASNYLNSVMTWLVDHRQRTRGAEPYASYPSSYFLQRELARAGTAQKFDEARDGEGTTLS